MIIVTGAAGFIGSCIVAQLNGRGREDLVLVDHLHQGLNEKNLENKMYSRYVDKADFIEMVRQDRVPEDVECLIHMGACSSTTLQDKEYFETNNFAYTRTLAEWAIKRKVRFIYASSAATYGDGSCGYRDDDETVRRCSPLNLYGESKQKFDLWALDNGILDRVVGLKFFNVFGPNEYHKADMRSVIAKSYQRVVDEGKISLFRSYHPDYADGEQKRDFIYVKDAVEIVLFFMDHPEVNGIFNAGTGEAATWNMLARALFKAVGKPEHVEYIEMPEVLKSRYQYFTQADMAKLKNAGYNRPFTPLKEAIGDYAEYLRDHAYL